MQNQLYLYWHKLNLSTPAVYQHTILIEKSSQIHVFKLKSNCFIIANKNFHNKNSLLFHKIKILF
jgi:hypothetical protein